MKNIHNIEIESLNNSTQSENEHLNNVDVAETWSNVYKDINGFGFVVTVTLPLVVSTSLSEKLSTGVDRENSVSFLGKGGSKICFYST